jgi:CheY-like chemotaxis protein
MGLASVYACVKQHHGQITVESEPGRGTVFAIFLPLTETEVKPVANDTRYETLKGEGFILIVDDEEVNRQIMEEMLSLLDYRVVSRSNGREAVEYYRQHHKTLDLVVLDMNMPEMNGPDCFIELKKINPAAAVLFASGSDPEKTGDPAPAGHRGILRKPFRVNDLGRAVKKALEKV